MSASLFVVDPAPAARRTLRVRVASLSSEWLRRWRARLAARGHVVVSADAPCDVVLADGSPMLDSATLTVVVGGIATTGAPTAAGTLDGNATDDQVEAALHAVAAGLVVQSRLHERGFAAAHETSITAALSPREAQVLSAIANGDSNKVIARKLGISLHTVKFHVESLFRKLDARSRAEAVARAVEYRRRETIEL